MRLRSYLYASAIAPFVNQYSIKAAEPPLIRPETNLYASDIASLCIVT